MSNRPFRLPVPGFWQCVVLGLAVFAGWSVWTALQTVWQHEHRRQALWDPEADAVQRHQAAASWARMGPEAVPELVRALDDDHATVRRGAVMALERIGPEAVAAVPRRRELMEDEGEDPLVRTEAVSALRRIDHGLDEMAASFARLLEHGDERLAESAAQVLVKIGPAAVAPVHDA
jgi:HEAT repeat protein